MHTRSMRMAQYEAVTPVIGHLLPCLLQAHQFYGDSKALGQQRGRARHGPRSQGHRVRSTTNALEEADWEEEMSLFRKRLQKPNQLETMRKIVEEVDLGKVHIHPYACLSDGNSTLQEHLSLTVMAPSADAGVVGPCWPQMLFYCVHAPAAPESMHAQVLLTGDGFAVIEGLNNDAPIGCSLKFVSGSSGVLLWRRSDNIVYALILGRQGAVEEGEAVECRIRAILQARAADSSLQDSHCNVVLFQACPMPPLPH